MGSTEPSGCIKSKRGSLTASSHRSQSYGVGPHRTFCCIGMASVPRSRLVSLHGHCNHPPPHAFRLVHLSLASSDCDSSPSPSLYHHPNSEVEQQSLGQNDECRKEKSPSFITTTIPSSAVLVSSRTRLPARSSICWSSPQVTRAVYLLQRGSSPSW